ncbi:MAG: aminotransferase class IV [Micromonosporaceae bacterium]
MATSPFPIVEINDAPPTAEQLRYRALVNYGHYTALQVRDRRVRGLDLHLRRLDAATRELYGTGLPGVRVCAHIRHALGDDIADASVRVDVFWPEGAAEPLVMVTVRPPVPPPDRPRRLRSMPYQRPVAHLKHVGTFGQIHYGQLAERDGYDDALLTAAGGVISEGGVTNIGFWDGETVVWPDAPQLSGITMQLIEARLPGSGLATRRATVRLADLAGFRTVFVTNSHGVAAVSQVDDMALPVDAELLRELTTLYLAVPADLL